MNAQGEVIRKYNIENLAQGSHSFVWDGRDNDGDLMPDGSYHYNVYAKTESGEDISVSYSKTGQVGRIRFEGSTYNAGVCSIEILDDSTLKFKSDGRYFYIASGTGKNEFLYKYFSKKKVLVYLVLPKKLSHLQHLFESMDLAQISPLLFLKKDNI